MPKDTQNKPKARYNPYQRPSGQENVSIRSWTRLRLLQVLYRDTNRFFQLQTRSESNHRIKFKSEDLARQMVRANPIPLKDEQP